MGRKLNDQWVEVIDGQKHMVKETKSENSKVVCQRCLFSGGHGICNYPEDDCPVRNGCYIKDLGILREGKLPSSFGVYPTTVPPSEAEELWLLYAWVKKDGIVSKKEMAYGKTEQEAIDNWNRRT